MVRASLFYPLRRRDASWAKSVIACQFSSKNNCLGATHARQIMKILLKVLTEKVQSITIQNYEENVEQLGELVSQLPTAQIHATVDLFEQNQWQVNHLPETAPEGLEEFWSFLLGPVG